MNAITNPAAGARSPFNAVRLAGCMAGWMAACLVLLAPAARAADLTVRVLDKNGQPLPDAVVLVTSAGVGAHPAPLMEATIKQEKLRFKPALTVVHPGARVTFTNQDAWDHHVIFGLMGPGGFYLDTAQNQQLRLAGKVGETVAQDTRVLAKPGGYLLGCHLHSSMRGFLYVADTPWAQATDADGRVTLTGVPVGPANVRVWHADQLMDAAPLLAQVPAAGTAVVLNTAVLPQKRR
ncbi:plastocyanin [Roseateles sp. BYS87W]|uniref:Plastocyanin n=1 Tax=Pelomonas baiyunensis TaxID=3299026 RepID=A0ABW7GTC5_9BURK